MAAANSVMGALEAGLSKTEIKERLAGLRQETEVEKRLALRVLCFAMKWEVDVFQVVLDAMTVDVILAANVDDRTALEEALWLGKEGAAMAVVERMTKEKLKERSVRPFGLLFDCPLKGNKAVEEAVVSLLTCGVSPSPANDILCSALRFRKKAHKEEAVEMCLRHYGPMADWMVRFEGSERFRYIITAAEYCDLDMVQKMHDLQPLLSDGSGRRGEESDYGRAVASAAANDRISPVWPVMEYLVSQGGVGVLDTCGLSVLLSVPTDEDVEWLVARAPQLLQEVCDEGCLKRMIFEMETASCMMGLMVKLLDPKVIVELMQQPTIDKDQRSIRGADGWRWELEKLHRGVPECMDGLRWPWLMEAIQEAAYRDVDYMLGLCKRHHLVMRNEEGCTAYDVAARDRRFPRQLLDRLKVVTKGAHS